MRRAFAWVGGAFGAASLLRLLRRRTSGAGAGAEPADPAEELRRRLAEARDAADDRDEFDAAEGIPVDAAEPLTIEERRRAVHDRAQEALDHMRSRAEPGE